jgi:hypothetical protein
MKQKTLWQTNRSDIFWKDIATNDHVLQVYENETIFLDTLAGFVGGGINAGDCAIVIATSKHLKSLEARLKSFGVHVESLIKHNRYMPLDAAETLSKFMVNGWPDEALFFHTIGNVVKKARVNNTGIRAFGEMVVLLWEQGYTDATIELERLWNKFCETETFCLFCAYPESVFKNGADEVEHICCSHSKMITGSEATMTEIAYRQIA